MGGPYQIPRNYKGESRILLVFSTKALIYTAVAGGFGMLFYTLFNAMKLKMLGIGFVVLFAFIGFAIGTFKIPENNKNSFMSKAGGENIDTIIIRWIKFKMKHNRIYVYKDKEVETNGK